MKDSAKKYNFFYHYLFLSSYFVLVFFPLLFIYFSDSLLVFFCLSFFLHVCLSLLLVSTAVFLSFLFHPFLFLCHLFYRTRFLFYFLFFTCFFPFISISLFIALYSSLFFRLYFFCFSFAFLFIPPYTCSFFSSYLPPLLVYSLSLPLFLFLPTNLSGTNCE